MKSVIFHHGEVSLEDRPLPEPRPGEARLKVLMAGICQTDLELLAGYYDFSGIPGHEFVGLVDKAPSAPEWIGRRATASINIGCGHCPECRSGDPRHCPDRKALGIKGWEGALAEYVLVPVRNLIEVTPDVPDQAAVFAEPLAAALQVAEKIHLKPQMKSAVLGDGKLGLLAAIALSRYLPGLLLIGKHPRKMDLAARQGVRTLASHPRIAEELAAKFDLVVEATGRSQGLPLALAMTRPRGVVAVKTTRHDTSTIDLAHLVVNEISLVGSRCGDLALALTFLKNRWVDVDPLIQGVFPLDDVQRALDLAAKSSSLKVLVAPSLH